MSYVCAAFIAFLLDQGTTAEELTAALDASPDFRAKVRKEREERILSSFLPAHSCNTCAPEQHHPGGIYHYGQAWTVFLLFPLLASPTGALHLLLSCVWLPKFVSSSAVPHLPRASWLHR